MNNPISFDHRLLGNFCWPLLLSMVGLCACGLLNLYSLSSYADFMGEWSWFSRQSLYFGVALGGLIVALFFDYQLLKRIAWPLYFLSVVLLLAVFFKGSSANEATRWLDLGFVRFQPSEAAKIAVILALAAWLSDRDLANGLDFKDLPIPALIILVPFALIHKQPDLGTALHLLGAGASIFLVFKIRPRLLLSILLAVGLGAGLIVSLAASGSWHVLQERGLIKPHQINRINTFLNPEQDPSNKGFQIIQSRNAVGGGQLFGRGFMAGTQHRNRFLPEAETDFAFAALAEEWGFVGSVAVLSLFLCLLSAGLMLARRSKDRFGCLIILGLTSMLFWQVVINVGMVVGLLPVVGIPLPFISYGGSSLVVCVGAVALVLNVGMRRSRFQDEPIQENPFVWSLPAKDDDRLVVTVPVRRLAIDTPFNPELHPRHRLPHTRPWAKYLRKARCVSDWQSPDAVELMKD
ncbi:MAG: rod shape-determining protein RodA [Candidatus Adiutrix sp.]|nr:rod shape-determining protein RodA [Candidatus Adiutrix sp.]